MATTFCTKSVALNKLFYESQSEMIKITCRELDMEDKIDELIEKLLTNTFTKIKLPKNPDKPKKPLTAYMFFCNTKRSDVMGENPGMSIGDVSKILGKMWKELSDEDKQPYVEMNTKDKERHEAEEIAFKRNN